MTGPVCASPVCGSRVCASWVCDSLGPLPRYFVPRMRRANAAIAAYRTGNDLRIVPVIGEATEAGRR